MNKQMKIDLEDLPVIVDDIIKGFDKLNEKEQVDASARLNAIRLKCEKHCDAVKETFKQKFKGKDGVVVGVMFEAHVTVNNVTRLDQQYLKINHEDAYNDSLKSAKERRVDYKPR